MYSMICKQLPFQSNDRKQTFKQIKEKNPDFSHNSFTEDVSPAAIDLIKQMLHKDPTQRISVENALKHPFFHNANTNQKKSQNQSGPLKLHAKQINLISMAQGDILPRASMKNDGIMEANIPGVIAGHKTIF